jgi:hypothetical protein
MPSAHFIFGIRSHVYVKASLDLDLLIYASHIAVVYHYTQLIKMRLHYSLRLALSQILLISISRVAEITGVRHQARSDLLAVLGFELRA